MEYLRTCGHGFISPTDVLRIYSALEDTEALANDLATISAYLLKEYDHASRSSTD